MKVDRYFTRGLVDGSLTTLGVVIGASAADPSIIIVAGVGGGVANALSNAFGALTAESAEVERRFVDIEKSMLSGLRKTLLYKSMRNEVLLSGFSDCIASILGALIPVLPFLLIYVFEYSTQFALIASIMLTLCVLFILGVYLGAISRSNLLLSGLKMALIGAITAFVCTLIEHALQARFG